MSGDLGVSYGASMPVTLPISPARALVEAVLVALFADFQRRVTEDLDEAVADDLAGLVALEAER